MNMLQSRVRHANYRPVEPSGQYVLYWMQAYRRFRSNHALDYALQLAESLKKPLVVYEGLRLDYPWACQRHHAWMLEGMKCNAAMAEKLGLSYWPFVETEARSGHGLLRTLSHRACAVVSDDYPAFIVPAQNRALAGKIDTAFHLVDSNSVVPLSLLGDAVSAAAHLRPRIHRLFPQAWEHRASSEPRVPRSVKSHLPPPFTPWDFRQDIREFLNRLPLDTKVPPVAGHHGGAEAGREALMRFVAEKLARYASDRNQPDDPAHSASSGLSPYLRHGHLGIEEVVAAVLEGSNAGLEIDWSCAGRREGFYSPDPALNAFLDEAITWRDVGYHWHWVRNAKGTAANVTLGKISRSDMTPPQFNFESMDFSPVVRPTLEVVLPKWAQDTLRKHQSDAREYLYSLEEFEAAATHDELWNAAQRELVATGRIHNYLRMLWGKKVLEWSSSPVEAYTILEHLNNKYAIDGRDPNSYTGILWCFGLFDRPWAPERKIFGSVRYMSSENTARKFKLAGYFDYVNQLPTVAQVHSGDTTPRSKSLFG